MNLIDAMTEREAKELLNEISNIFGIGGMARNASVILSNVKNSFNDEFCEHKKAIEFLEGRVFKFIKKPNGYIFTRPGFKPDFSGKTIIECVQRAISYEDEIEEANQDYDLA